MRHMRVTDALKILHGAPKEGKPFEVTLACGFTPLHLQTFLAAHLQEALPDRSVTVSTGLYGDLARTIEATAECDVNNLAIAVEWMDLDLRLGYRASVVWDSNTLPDVLSCVRKALERLTSLIAAVPSGTKIAISTPTLPLSPLFHNSSWQMSESETVLAVVVAEFAAQMASLGIPIVNSMNLAEESAPGLRYDLKSDLLLGLPYTPGHADKLALALSRLLCPRSPKKGIITDLDDTLWSGLVGEVGQEGIHWDLDSHSGLHALYQSLLASLAEQGILIGVASKNDSVVVEKAFERSDLLLRKERVFPMEVHWQAKSASVKRILRAWNVSADAVVFVDDSPMELAEVAAAHPGIECVQYPGKDYAAGRVMLRHLRDLFGKQKLSSEDSFRLDTVRQSVKFQEAAGGSNPERFLQEAKATVHFDFQNSKEDSRPLELVNKTNQFNLNGTRYTESDWAFELSRPNVHLIVTSYEDRFGRLGKIAVIMGILEDSALSIRTWVMSCRAFSRRIEYLCLKTCFERYGVREIDFDFKATDKNGPLQEFLAHLLGQRASEKVRLTRERFEQVCPALYHALGNGRSRPLDG
jgi:FkbH-like protein